MYFISVETTAGTWLQHTVGSWILCFTQAKQWFCKVIARKQQQKFNLQIYIHTVRIYLEAADDIKVSVQWNLYTVYKSMCNHNMQCTCAPQTYYYGGVLGHPVRKREAFKEIYLSGLVPVSNDVTSHQRLPLKTVCSILFSHSLPAFNFAVLCVDGASSPLLSAESRKQGPPLCALPPRSAALIHRCQSSVQQLLFSVFSF